MRHLIALMSEGLWYCIRCFSCKIRRRRFTVLSYSWKEKTSRILYKLFNP